MAESLYNPELYSHVITRLDNGNVHTLTGFAKGGILLSRIRR